MAHKVLAIAIVGLACGRVAVEETPEPPVQAPAVTQPAAAPEPVAEPAPAIDLASYPEAVQAYYAHCDHSFEDDMEGRVVDECLVVYFDQNCAMDPSGCWDQGESCKEDCPGECSECSAECTTTCDGCKEDCPEGDDECRVVCAQARSGCRDACMGKKSKCNDACEKDRTACYARFEEEVKEKCPKCADMTECIGDAMQDERDPFEVCAKRYRRQSTFCKEACLVF